MVLNSVNSKIIYIYHLIVFQCHINQNSFSLLLL
nr:MAG TPA: hypothetical protein [Bacteriophage sp.]